MLPSDPNAVPPSQPPAEIANQDVRNVADKLMHMRAKLAAEEARLSEELAYIRVQYARIDDLINWPVGAQASPRPVEAVPGAPVNRISAFADGGGVPATLTGHNQRRF